MDKLTGLTTAQGVAKWKEYLDLQDFISADESAMRGTIDFETRSIVPLPEKGAWLYSKHPTTELLCLAYRLPGQKTKLWHTAHPTLGIRESPLPTDLFDFIVAGGLLEAHNAFFERCIWANVCVAKYGWPDVGDDQWRCSLAKASASNLPRSLESAAKALDLKVEKDMEGNAAMKRLCAPRKMTSSEVSSGRLVDARLVYPDDEFSTKTLVWREAESDIRANWAYCIKDVDVEHELSESLEDLSPYELHLWQIDQRMNLRGVRVDLDQAEAALEVSSQWKTKLNAELFDLTGIERGTLRKRVREWLEEYAQLELPDTKADTVDWFLKNVPMKGIAYRVLTILKEVNKTSTAKYSKMLKTADPEDSRIRDILLFQGASTGRWTGKGVQVHNFPSRNLIIKDQELAVGALKTRDAEWCALMYGDVMQLLSHSLRGAIVPTEGRKFMIADYAAIEARCVVWLADARSALQVFENNGDIYCDMASGIYGYEVTKKYHPDERMFGKQAILGLGYGMGFLTFFLTCRKYGIGFTVEQVQKIMGAENYVDYVGKIRKYLGLDITDADSEDPKKQKAAKLNARKAIRKLKDNRENPEDVLHELALMKHTVDVYRARYPEVKNMWTAQNAAAIRAVETGQVVECGKIKWEVQGRFLCCVLPSGRAIKYRDPEVKIEVNDWGSRTKGLRFMSAKEGSGHIIREATYGGKLVENITQALARDIMAHAMVNVDKHPLYDLIMTIHDEVVGEVDLNKGCEKEFEALMCDLPNWAKGCPVTAEAETAMRYKK